MNEDDLERLLLRPLDDLELTKIDARARRSATLAEALWGKTPRDLERQLLAVHPELPPRFQLADYRALERSTQRTLLLLKKPKVARLFSVWSSSAKIGNTQYTEMEARLEIVRRAIRHLERSRD